MRAKALYREALVVSATQLIEDLDKLGIAIPTIGSTSAKAYATSICASVIRRYLIESEPRVRAKRDYSDLTKRLGSMTEGQCIAIEPQPLQSIRQRMDSARKMMDNPQACWSLESLPGKILCTRRLDGEGNYYRDPAKNPKVRELAKMNVGREKWAETLESTRGKGQMGSNTKIMARRLMNEPQADWSVKRVGSRVLLRRIK